MTKSWLVAGHTVASLDHPDVCQDSVAAQIDETGRVLLCVADGAGTSGRALEASRRALQIAVDSFSAQSPLRATSAMAVERWMRGYFHECGSAFESWLDHENHDVNDYNTTMAVLLLVDDWLALASVGDSFALTLDDVAGLQILHQPDRPDTTRTTAAYMLADWAEHTIYKIYWVPTLQRVLLSTDGLEKFLRFRPVQDAAGRRRQVAWGVHTFLEELIKGFGGAQADNILETLSEPRIRTVKRDDIGLALAARQPD